MDLSWHPKIKNVFFFSFGSHEGRQKWIENGFETTALCWFGMLWEHWEINTNGFWKSGQRRRRRSIPMTSLSPKRAGGIDRVGPAADVPPARGQPVFILAASSLRTVTDDKFFFFFFSTCGCWVPTFSSKCETSHSIASPFCWSTKNEMAFFSIFLSFSPCFVLETETETLSSPVVRYAISFSQVFSRK